MSAIPVIPPEVATLEQLDAWIEQAALDVRDMASRLRLVVAVMDRATQIGDAMRRADSA